MSLGNISGRTSVITKTTVCPIGLSTIAFSLISSMLQLVMNLMDDSSADEIRLLLPVAIGAQRYGLSLPEARDAAHSQTSTRLRFTATVQTGGYLRKLYNTCQSGGRVGGKAEPSACYVDWSHVPSEYPHNGYRVQFSHS